MNSLNFFSELKRRNVYKVAVAYLVAAWLLIQAASIFLPAFNAPQWAMQVVILILLIGFPIALVFSWAFEITPEGIKLESEVEPGQSIQRKTGRWLVALTVVLAIVAAAFYYWPHQDKVLTDKDHIVLADFTNTTGDPVFDDTLRQGLAAQLEQTPFLSLISDSAIAHTLTLMSKVKTERLTPELAREVGQRVGAVATIEGSISTLGTQYVLSLKAVNCKSGNLLAQQQETAAGKEQVLNALGQAATKLRQRLGESLVSVQKYDALPEDTTTSSLEALQAYALGSKATDVDNDYLAAIPFFQRAVALDPNFAMAYMMLAGSYQPQGELTLAAENARKAYDLRERTSDHEKLSIAAFYEIVVTGNLEAARRSYELIAQTYPRDEVAQTYLWYIHLIYGDYARADV
ncbi:MAG: eukaryotic-like serine/threonine-protein kinase, partial [Verrucomicrobiota bacterium]